MFGLGADILSLKRFQRTMAAGGEDFLRSVFSRRERELAAGRENSALFYAGRFAAKEALFKALAIGWEEGLKMDEMEILQAENGAPLAELTGRSARLAAERGLTEVRVSLSWEDEYVMAVALAAGPEKQQFSM